MTPPRNEQEKKQQQNNNKTTKNCNNRIERVRIGSSQNAPISHLDKHFDDVLRGQSQKKHRRLKKKFCQRIVNTWNAWHQTLTLVNAFKSLLDRH
jgi:hypothetical protein